LNTFREDGDRNTASPRQHAHKRTPDDHWRHKNCVLIWIIERVIEKLRDWFIASQEVMQKTGDICFDIHGHDSFVVEDMNGCHQLLPER
jgi:hypothetical protein